jgi:hypothetical protein
VERPGVVSVLKRCGTLLVLAAAMGGCAQMAVSEGAGAGAEGTGARPALLAALDGDWVMSGDVMGKAVSYRMHAGPTLGGQFTEIHMQDVQVPSEYEARVFVGYDAKSGRIITHWLDSFGPMFSVPHGTGKISDNTIEFIVPYDDGPFRDTLSFDPGRGRWRLEIESQKPSGEWQHFARYDFRRKGDLTR